MYARPVIILSQNIDCEAVLTSTHSVLTSTHNLCFGAKIRKISIRLPSFYYIKLGFKGVYITWICFPDVMLQD